MQTLAQKVIIAAALLAICLVALPAMGISIPAWAMQVLWIIVIALVCIFAIKFLLGDKSP